MKLKWEYITQENKVVQIFEKQLYIGNTLNVSLKLSLSTIFIVVIIIIHGKNVTQFYVVFWQEGTRKR